MHKEEDDAVDQLSRLEDLTLHSPDQERQPSCSGDCRSVMNNSSSDFFLSAPCSSSFDNGDYIGVESCVDVMKDDDEDRRLLDINGHDGDDFRNRQQQQQRLISKRDRRLSSKIKKEFPPLISLLARTENLTSHMPWILKRHYTSDGRLILTEEKVKHHEYFRAHRSNGRLTLQLVPLDGDVLGADNREMDEEDDQETAEIETDSIDPATDENNDIDDKDYDFMEVEEEDKDEQKMVEANNGGKYCIEYSSVRSGSPCIFGVPVPVPVPTIRPVHT